MARAKSLGGSKAASGSARLSHRRLVVAGRSLTPDLTDTSSTASAIGGSGLATFTLMASTGKRHEDAVGDLGASRSSVR